MLSNLFTSAGQLLAGQLSLVDQVIGALLVIAICAVGWLLRWNHQQRAAKKPGMASFFFIISCFAVALIAVGGATYGLGLRTIGNTEPQSPSKQRFTSYDLEARLKAIDTLDDAVAKLQPLVQEGHNDLLNNIDRYIQEGSAPDKLLFFATRAKETWDKISNSVGDYQSRFPDIARTISQDQNIVHAGALASTSFNLRQEVMRWSGSDQKMQIINSSRALLEWRQSVGSLSNYVISTRNSLAVLRRDYEHAEVYGQSK